MPPEVINILKRFTGELPQATKFLRDSRRMFIDEFTQEEQEILFTWLKQNRRMIVKDILCGLGDFTPEWILVTQKTGNATRWILKSMREIINHYDGEISISQKGSIKIGSILIQRKGGTPDPTSLQFKINPAEIFDMD
jgi:hypothetical protein